MVNLVLTNSVCIDFFCLCFHVMFIITERRSRSEDHVNVKDQLSPKTLARAEHDASTLPHFFHTCFCVHINLSAEKVKGFCFLCFFKTKHKIHSWLHHFTAAIA